MTTWSDLRVELAECTKVGVCPSFWWRDDDLGRQDSRLPLFWRIVDRVKVPICAAVVPGWIDVGIADEIRGRTTISVVQHGSSHVAYCKLTEYPTFRNKKIVGDEIGSGWKKIKTVFGDKAFPIFVPPWNHISPKFGSELEDLGFVAYSSRILTGPWVSSNLGKVREIPVHVNTTRPGAIYIGDEVFLESIVRHLRARRKGLAHPIIPTGVLTHYFIDPVAFDAMEKLVDYVQIAGGRWCDGSDIVNIAANLN